MNIKDKILTYAAISLILIGIVMLLSPNPFIGAVGSVGNEQQYIYTYTKAVCDESNYCEDYHIECQKDKLVKMTPTGFSVKMPSAWVDPRDKESVERMC